MQPFSVIFWKRVEAIICCSAKGRAYTVSRVEVVYIPVQVVCGAGNEFRLMMAVMMMGGVVRCILCAEEFCCSKRQEL